ncbi:MAG: hypothetical protein MJ227_00410 [Bacilli bacterium]|nr:hypothetical protein [Bacilli bacterium]
MSLKTNHNGAHPRSDLDLGIIPGLGTTSSTLAVVNQIRAIDKLRIYKRQAIGDKNLHLSEEDDEEYGYVTMLNEVKVNLLINAYFAMIVNNNG